MLVPNQKIKIRWSTSNSDWYISKGYTFTKYKDEFYVRAEDLKLKSDARVKVICDYCGEEYETQFASYYHGLYLNNKNACHDCSGKKGQDINNSKRAEQRYQAALEICEAHNYKLVSSVQDFYNIRNGRITFVCPKHGEQTQSLYNFLKKEALCYYCGRESMKDKVRKIPDDVEQYVNSFNGNVLLNKEDYVTVDLCNLKIKCGTCGNVFTTSLGCYKNTLHFCPQCVNVRSKGEKKIEEFLIANSIEFEPQKRFEDCRDKKPLPFDFYLPKYNLCIEFQGQQHFDQTEFFGGYKNYEKTIIHDLQKEIYCMDNHINYLEITWKQIDDVNTILHDKLLT